MWNWKNKCTCSGKSLYLYIPYFKHAKNCVLKFYGAEWWY